MSKPNEHFIALAKAATKMSEINLNDPMGLILANVQLGNLAALAKIALEKEAKTIRDSNGRPVVDLEVDGRGVDAFFSAATYDDDGSDVPSEELEYLTDTYPEIIAEQAHQNAVCAAEYAFEGDR